MNAPLDSVTLATRLAANPHNIGGINGAPRMCNFDYWAAIYEREGRNAKQGAPCPYNAGTMAATRWQAGQDQGGAPHGN